MDNPNNGLAYIRIHSCTLGTVYGHNGYCWWADVPPGSPSGHSDAVHVNRQCPACDVYNLSMAGNDAIEAGATSKDMELKLECHGRPAPNIGIRIDSAAEQPPKGTLQRAPSETASCVSGESLTCTTDADGRILYNFTAPTLVRPVDVLHDLTAVCTTPGKVCTPSPAGPARVTVIGKPYTLNLQVVSDTIQEGQVLHGHKVEVKFDGQPAAYVPVEISAHPQNLIYPAAELYPILLEQANCTPGSVMTCITDADGMIEFGFLAPTLDAIDDVLYDVSARCTDTAKPCTPDPDGPYAVTVTQCPIILDLSLTGGNKVEPNGELPGFVVSATDCKGASVPPLSVTLTNTYQAGTGGHQHGPNDDPLRLGKFSSTACSSGAAPGTAACTTDKGLIEFSFRAPAPAGIHNITARCTDLDKPCDQAGPVSVDVKVEGLVLVSNLPYRQTGDTDLHPLNHYLRTDAGLKLRQLATEYFRVFDQNLLYLNDASLPWGGLFDVRCVIDPNTGICPQPSQHVPWVTPHREHRCGLAIDVRGNGHPDLATSIPLIRHEEFKKMAEDYGIGVHREGKKQADGSRQGGGNAHYHLWLLGAGQAEDKEIVEGTKTCSQLLQ